MDIVVSLALDLWGDLPLKLVLSELSRNIALRFSARSQQTERASSGIVCLYRPVIDLS
ncbi:hypothetical protein CCP2SC5_80058 [Azospirillaceae bacterium]